MRILLATFFFVALVGTSFSDGRSAPTLVDVIGAEDVIAFRAVNHGYEFKVLDDAAKRASREWYKSESKEQRDQTNLRTAQTASPVEPHRVGEVVYRGSDFVGVRELEHDNVVLVPVNRIIDVQITGNRSEQHDVLALAIDDSKLKQREQKINVMTREAEVSAAKARVRVTTVARQEYLEGTFVLEEKEIMAQLALAEQEVRKAELALQSAEQLEAKGQLELIRYAVANAKTRLDIETGRLRVLREIKKQRMLVQLDSDIESAKRDLVVAEASLEQAQSELAITERQGRQFPTGVALSSPTARD